MKNLKHQKIRRHLQSPMQRQAYAHAIRYISIGMAVMLFISPQMQEIINSDFLTNPAYAVYEGITDIITDNSDIEETQESKNEIKTLTTSTTNVVPVTSVTTTTTITTTTTVVTTEEPTEPPSEEVVEEEIIEEYYEEDIYEEEYYEEEIVYEEEYDELPPKVEYYLTHIGYTLRPVIDSMQKWGKEYKRLRKLMEKYSG